MIAMTTNSVSSSNSSSPRFNYGEALQKSFLFYEAQRSGELPKDKRITWRGNSALNDGSDVYLDLSGGYFDAGDHVKYNLPMASAMTLLSWGVEQYREGYERSGQLDDAMDAIRWGTDFLLKSHITENGKTLEFWAQVGNPSIDHAVLELPEQIATIRPSYKINSTNPGTELAAEAAAALASASIIFRATDVAYSDKLLLNAQQLYSFADNYRGSYSDSLPNVTGPYTPQNGFDDELAWGAVWLHKALKAKGEYSQQYLNKAEAEYGGLNAGWTQDWDNKSQGTALLLAQETGKSSYKNEVSNWLQKWMPGGQVTRSPGGLAWLGGWGSLRLSANTAFLSAIYADTIEDPNSRYSQFAQQQIDYILGDNPREASYVVGFGNNSPQKVHHQAASQFMTEAQWASNQANTNILYGAIVGGPTMANDFAYQDSRQNYVANEVSLDYNAGYTGALAYLYSRYGGEPLSDTELNDLPGIQVKGAGVTTTDSSIGSSDAAIEASSFDNSTDITIISGSLGDDSLYGTSKDDDLLGRAGNDLLMGGGGIDYLYGTSSTNRGRGEVDRLTGGTEGDVFVLGDIDGAFYAAQGNQDYAYISDFDDAQDQLLLYGSAANYRIFWGNNQTWIFQSTSAQKDLVALLGNNVSIDLAQQLYT